MENKKQVGSSSFTADLFGETTSPSSSSGIFASIFPHPSTVVGRNSRNSHFTGLMQKQPSGSQVWSTKQGTSENVAKYGEGASNSVFDKENSSFFNQRLEPCPLSSSLYYGGQEDMYIQSSSAQTSRSYPIFKKEGGEDDPDGIHLHSASRGNWWQGSLYY